MAPVQPFGHETLVSTAARGIQAQHTAHRIQERPGDQRRGAAAPGGGQCGNPREITDAALEPPDLLGGVLEVGEHTNEREVARGDAGAA